MAFLLTLEVPFQVLGPLGPGRGNFISRKAGVSWGKRNKSPRLEGVCEKTESSEHARD